jgi:hypothetical protein
VLLFEIMTVVLFSASTSDPQQTAGDRRQLSPKLVGGVCRARVPLAAEDDDVYLFAGRKGELLEAYHSAVFNAGRDSVGVHGLGSSFWEFPPKPFLQV